jgi:protein-disulfide isomerase
VATVKGEPVLGKEILDKLRAQEAKAEAEYLGKVMEIRERALKGLVMDRILTAEAKKAGMATLEDYVRAEATKNKKPVDEARLRALYARLVPNGNPPFEEVRMELGQAAAQEDGQQAVATLVERVIKENDVKWLLPAPQFPKVDVSVDDDPMLGDKDAKVTIIEFSDFECPYCSQAATAVHEVADKYKGKVRVVYRDFPLSFHKGAKGAAMAAGCAQEQGKFWPFHDLLFKNQATLEDKALKTFARVAGLDGARFDECLTSEKFKDEVEKDMKDGEAVGVEGTPTFFINGRPFGGAPTVEGLSAAVEAALAG